MTTTATATELAEEVFAQLDPMFENLEGQVLVSQNRWVDHLLDLYNFVELPAVRRVIESTISEIRYQGSVEAGWVREQLVLLATAVEVESAFDNTAALIH
jgi:hypothetical protein